MAKRKSRNGSEPAGGSDDGVTVTVCRGCCCGSSTKHPEVEHRRQLEKVRAEVGAGCRVRVTDCLDACERSNVMVVSPSPAGRRAGARPVWLGEILHDGTTDDVISWVNAGGPGVVDAPNVLDLYEFQPSNRFRRAANG